VNGGGDDPAVLPIERLVVWMARAVADDDVAVVGIGTPVALAAFLLARALHAPRLHILMPGALDPAPRDLSTYLRDPVSAVSGARARRSRVEILDAIAAGEVSVQFVRPAQVDAQLRLNTERLDTPSGPLHLVGPVALPDVVARVGRVIAYLPRHDPQALVASVDTVTAPRGLSGGRVAAVITPLAQLRWTAGVATLAGRGQGVSLEEIRSKTGFVLGGDGATTIPEPSDEELGTLRSVVDPLGLIGLEDPGLRHDARQTLARLWSPAGTAHHQEAAP
jgi:acyl CoA:acetate/3-ketoacid CoA transferase beta subunit